MRRLGCILLLCILAGCSVDGETHRARWVDSVHTRTVYESPSGTKIVEVRYPSGERRTVRVVPH